MTVKSLMAIVVAAGAVAVAGMSFSPCCNIGGNTAVAATPAAGESVAIGDTAPDFSLPDLDGKTHTLKQYIEDGKIVVLQWFNPDCPFVVKHYGSQGNTFNQMQAQYKDKGVVLLAINSGAPGKQGAGVERNAKAKKDWNIQYPILLDEAGTAGKAYGAKNTPAMYIIGKDGKLAYMGAIDDNRGADGPGKVNYVTKALDEMLAGKPVTNAETRPYGCSVKYK